MATTAISALARALRCELHIVNTCVEPLIVVLVCIGAGPPALVHAGNGPPWSRLRVLDPDLEEVVHAGRDGSATFRALVDRLEGGDVVVYVQCAQLPAGLLGQLTFMSAAAGRRYVMVRIARGLDQARQIAALGHELQHAIEILDEPRIVDLKSFEREYARFGIRSRAAGVRGVAFDTVAAIVAGRQVSRELATTTRTARAATR